MAIHGNRDPERLTEIIEDDCRRPCVGSPVVPGHTSRLVQQESHTERGHLIGQRIFVEHPGVRPKQRVGVQTSAHQQARLLAAPTAVLHLLEN